MPCKQNKTGLGCGMLVAELLHIQLFRAGAGFVLPLFHKHTVPRQFPDLTCISSIFTFE